MKRRICALFTVLCMMVLCVPAALVTDAEAAKAVSIAFESKGYTVEPGSTATLSPSVTGADVSDIKWSSSDTSAVQVKNGKVKAGKSGTAVITASVGGTSAKIKIFVGKRVTGVMVSKKEITLTAGDTYKVSASVRPSDAAYKGVELISSKPGVVSVDGFTIKAVKAGTAKITVRALDGSNKKTTINVTVEKAKKSTAKKAGSSDDALRFTANIKAGWNLGNTLDATGGAGLNTETSWVHIRTTEKMLKDIKSFGFNAVRIPVSWSKHVDAGRNIDKEWMARVKEVVDYAYGNGMYVILNTHHDESLFSVGQEKKYDDSIADMKKLWKQIAAEFKDYGERLIFETLNEPREVGTKYEWSGGTQPMREFISKLNNELVNTIRTSGGNNGTRFIMCPGYAATSDTNILKNTTFPDDDHVIVSVHYYKPDMWNGNKSGEFTDDEKRIIDDLCRNLNEIFISKNRAVIIGECGAPNWGNDKGRAAWDGYMYKTAKSCGIPCFLWDNDAFNLNEQSFGIYDRETGKVKFKKVVEEIMNAMM